MTDKFIGDAFEMTSNSPDDPRLKKRFGFISALPSEYLLHFRQGELRKETSGQAATCFKRWMDTVFIVPTSLKEIIFEANQLTSDNVDVRIRGMAVYRISDPLRIYKLINFSNRQAAEQKLARMISDLCRSNAKWLVANMDVEECIRKRKEEIAESLRKEVAHIVTQEDGGWGVEIITIDTQDVYIQDSEIFGAMQMQFKTQKLRESSLAELEMANELETRKLALQRHLSEQRKQTRIEEARIEAEVKEEQLRLSRQSDEKQFALDRYRVEQNEQIQLFKLEQSIEQERHKTQLAMEKAQAEVDAQKLRHSEEIAHMKARIEVENQTSPASLERHFVEHALPEIARILGENMKNTRMNIYQNNGTDANSGGQTPFFFALQEILQLLRERIERSNDKP